MDLDDLEREISKVTQQGGIARVPEATALEAMAGETHEERKAELADWVLCMCEEHHLKTDSDKDMLGLVELLFFHGPDYHGHS